MVPRPKAPDVGEPAQPVAPLDLGLLAALPSLPLRARYLVESFLTGRHRSPVKGTAPEFAEYRPYQPGDELRRVDWRLYGRSDRLFVKQFEDEHQLRLCLALDLSASLRYASAPGLLTKFDFARMLLAAVALLARRQQDAVGLALLGDRPGSADAGLADYVRPASSPAHRQAVIDRLDSPPLTATASLAAALPRLSALLPRGSLIVLASDFYADPDELEIALRLCRSRRQEVIGLQVLDPMELEFAAAASGRFVDLEDGSQLALDPASCRAGYLQRFGDFRRDLQERFRRHEADLVLQRTDANPLDALAAYLARRGRLAR